MVTFSKHCADLIWDFLLLSGDSNQHHAKKIDLENTIEAVKIFIIVLAKPQ